MKITINGEETTWKAPLDIKTLLEQQGYGNMTVAIAHNSSFISKDQHAETILKDGDDIEIVAPMQGG